MYVFDKIDSVYDIFEEKVSKKYENRIKKFLKKHNYDPKTKTIEINDIDKRTGKKARVLFNYNDVRNHAFTTDTNWKSGDPVDNPEDLNIGLKISTVRAKPMVSDFLFGHEEGHAIAFRHSDDLLSHPIAINYKSCIREINDLKTDVEKHERDVIEFLADIYSVNNTESGMSGLNKAMDNYISNINRYERRVIKAWKNDIIADALQNTEEYRDNIESNIKALETVTNNKKRKERLLSIYNKLVKLNSLSEQKETLLKKISEELGYIEYCENEIEECRAEINRIVTQESIKIAAAKRSKLKDKLTKIARNRNSLQLRKERTKKYLKESSVVINNIFDAYENNLIGDMESEILLLYLEETILINSIEEKGLTFMEHSLVKDLMFIYGFESSDPNVNDEIEPVVKALEKKGYNVKYSSPGYDETRFDNDRNDDGVINSKLVSTARIIFDSNHNFKVTPQCWEWKILKNGSKALYVKPYSYNPKAGTKKEAFIKWKERYMANLRSWVVDLPKAGTETKSAPADTNFDAS